MRSLIQFPKLTNFRKRPMKKGENNFSSRNSKSLRIFESRLFSKQFKLSLTLSAMKTKRKADGKAVSVWEKTREQLKTDK